MLKRVKTTIASNNSIVRKFQKIGLIEARTAKKCIIHYSLTIAEIELITTLKLVC